MEGVDTDGAGRVAELADLPVARSTTVGPLPDAAPDRLAAAAAALNPTFPTTPSSSHPRRSLLAQVATGLEGVAVDPSGALRVEDAAALAPRGGATEGAAWEPLLGFAELLPRHERRGARVAVLGPVTLMLALRAAGVPDAVAARLAPLVVAERALAALAVVRAAMPGGTALVVAVEPGLVGAMHPTFPLAPATVLDLLVPVVDELDARGGDGLLIGVHVPGRTDWPTVVASGVSVVSAPADEAMATWPEGLGRFLAAGGRVAWGAVPVDRPLGSGAELLWRQLSSLWCELVAAGVDPLLLRTRSLIGPADGLASFSPDQLEGVAALVESLSERVQRQAMGARLALGA